MRFHHAEDNLTAAREPKRLCEILGDHNDALATHEGQEKFRAGLEQFLSVLHGSQGNPPAAEKAP